MGKYDDILKSMDKERGTVLGRTKNDRVLIVDGTNTFIRCWSAIPTMNDDGEHIGGVTGVLKSIGLAIKMTNPTRVIVVFDGKGGSKVRKKIFSGYKKDRNNKLRVNRQYADLLSDEDEKTSMKRQFVWLAEMLSALPVTIMIYDNIEADDVIAYISKSLLTDGKQSVIMSTDKDFLQLVDGDTIIWSPTKKKIYNSDTIREEFGIEPKNMILYRVLDGDISDKIPGVKGVGLKTLLKRIPELSGPNLITVDDLLKISEDRRGQYKIFDTILESVDRIRDNEKLMQLQDVNISGILKSQIMEQFDSDTKPLSKVDFVKVLSKYRSLDSLGDLNGWIRNTFGRLITD